ncbi:TonB-dependent receptor [Maribellus maritimus]|uniref:TonB-dependent receptor n=1 Tax=Maribellus maritimus TaxID=2870838 RepID=UPI001EEA2A7B|nr:TonB-dependent receptor [Maribellus maritimus]MCG6190522.1 TonB-dependent receptor [Maribellus maritimus]
MRFTLFLFFLSLFQTFATTGYSQDARVSLNIKNSSVGEVLRDIEEQTDYFFLYNNKLVDVNRLVTVNCKDRKVENVLEQIFDGTDVDFVLKDRMIVLTNQLEQQIKVTGKVTDSNGVPLPGVTVLVPGTTIGAVTNPDGTFELEIPSKAESLTFSFIGLKTQEVELNNRTNIDVQMEEDVIGLDEVIAVGYGVMKKSDLTGSVQRVNAEQYAAQQNTSMIEMLNGTVAGFNSTQGTSAAGGGSMEVRGPTSLAADTNPLVVLDGVIYNGNIGDINPNDIESIDILKDASSAAIFGARSASGILIVTTKRGQTSKPTVNFSTKIGVTGLTHHMRSQSPEEYLQSRGDYWADVNQDKPDYYYTNPNNLPDGLAIEEWKNYDATPSDDVIQMWFDRMGMTQIELDNYKAGKTVDWYDQVYRNGLRQDYDLSLSGGTALLKYYWSFGYTDNEGVTLGDDYKNVRSRVNIDADVTDFLKVGANVQYADRDQSSQSTSLGNAISASPYGNIYEEDGKTLTFYPHGDNTSLNPLLYYEYRDKLDKTQTLFATIFGEIKFPFGISYKVSYVNRYTWRKNYYFDPITTPNGFSNQGYGSRVESSSYEWQVDNVFKWKKSFAGIHEFDATFLINAEKYQYWQSSQENSQFAPSGALSYHALQAGISPNLNDNDQYSTGNALMARLNYSLMDKYILTGTWRRDGYSAFGQKHPYAEFPSAAVGWRISEENFFNVNWIDNLKMRISWGANGNRAVGRYDALARLGTTKYIYGTTLATGVYSSTMANSDLRWERTEAFNFGIDFGIFNNVLFGSMEYYDMTTKDLLLNRSLPRIIGYSSVAANLGELGNRGFELTLNSTNINKSNLRWNSNLVFSFNRNKIKHLYGEMIDVLDENGNVIGQQEADDIGNGWFIGESLDRIWDYEILGVWQLGEEEEAAVYGKQPGDMKLRDVNEDGILNPTDDKVFQGYKTPQYRIGFRNDFTIFKNFEISAFIRADLGYYGVNNLHLNSGANTDFERRNRMYRPYWTYDNPINDYARLNSDTDSPGFNYWGNRSFVRLQDLLVSYNIPKSKISKYKIQNLKIFASFRNLLTITGWEHYDPESGTNMMPMYTSIGIDISL